MGMGNWDSVETYEQLVTWRLQSRDEIAIENAAFFKYLIEQVGSEIATPWIKEYLDGVTKEIEEVGGQGGEATERVPMLRVEGGLSFWPYLNNHKSFQNPKDPINLVFWKNGAASVVSDVLANRTGGWANTQGSMLYAFIDDSQHGGTMDWKRLDIQLRKGSFWTHSSHLRLYQAPWSCTHGRSVYSLAGAHQEQFLTWPPTPGCIRGHRPLSWDNARDIVAQDMASVAGLVGLVSSINLNTAGQMQGVAHDGHVTFMEVEQPTWIVTI